MKNIEVDDYLLLDMTEEEFEEAIDGLIEKGFLVPTMKDGRISYELTPQAIAFQQHETSDPKVRN
jgi:hypothetical protein